ncbi:Valine--tRNA ligase [Thelohanellus kitauei]|uniref:valine--tRNA ligase n=1 Tax=Thelohanellus kitauei TaxID=669202 RepID=A0A0C2I574_THEKT|nr:Valine--tRNA ligase [Thelohanellus kitauei]
MKRLGVSLDWERSFFTMDECRSKAVTHAFVKLFERGLIYRSKKLVNWSCALKSAISDIEVDKVEIKGRQMIKIPGYDHKIEFGTLTEFVYRIEDSEDVIPVSTTRIETMLGDVAIAVHSSDQRYLSLVGKFAVHPFCHRRLRIIADDSVDPSFGTGAVKITPAHDCVDYEIGIRHKLEMINIFDDEGLIVSGLDFKDEYKCLSGMKRFEARKQITLLLKTSNLFIRSVDHDYVVPFCSRTRDVIEPLLKSQWFVDCAQMARRTSEVVVDGQLKIYPPQYEKIWLQWMNNLQDWCISRQLWWGHRIPAYFVRFNSSDSDKDNSDYWVSGESYEDALLAAQKKFNRPVCEMSIEQDEDVLDTWFSSGLLPLSACRWPDKCEDFDCFFPSTLLETGYDILFFWVARMVMLSLELRDTLPFKEILLHSIVRDSHGRKMSKSLGNIIDPIDVIEGSSLADLQRKLLTYNLDESELLKAKKGQSLDFPSGIPECGSDALRFTLCAYSGSAKDINLDVLRIQGYRFFCNKIWNASRFCLSNFGSNFVPHSLNAANLGPVDKWILSRLSSTELKVNKSFLEYSLSESTSLIHQFWLYDFCDVYIESLKPIFSGSNAEEIEVSRQVMFTCLDNALRLLHPFMPFITEEIYQRLPFNKEHFQKFTSVSVVAYPHELIWYDEELETDFESVMALVNMTRSLKDDYVPTKTKIPVYVCFYSENFLNKFSIFTNLIETLVNTSSIKFTMDSTTVPKGGVVSTFRDICDIHIYVSDSIDIASEVKKNTTKREKTFEGIVKIKAAMESQDYFSKVPVKVQEANSEKLASLECELSRLDKILESLKIGG